MSRYSRSCVLYFVFLSGCWINLLTAESLVATSSVPTSGGLVHLTCFSTAGASDLCCQDIWDMRTCVCKDTKAAELCGANENGFLSFCANQVATMPKTMEDSLGASHSLVLFAEDLDNSQTRNLSSKIEEDENWVQMCRSDKKERQTSPMDSPFYLSDIATNDDISIVATLMSDLSPDGGMHRILTHTIDIRGIRDDAAFRGYVSIYLFVPQSTFVDLDDPFEGNCLATDISCHAELRSSSIIDIEKPTFVSRQHVVAIQLNFASNTQVPQEIVSMQVKTKMHLRYPPLASDRTKRVPVHIPAPALHRIVLIQASQTTEVKSKSTASGPISLDAAAGVQTDFEWVVGLTLLASFVGSCIVLFDIARVSKLF